MNFDIQIPVKTEGNEHRVIRLTDFYYKESIPDGRSKTKTIDRMGIAENILVVGTDRIKILSNKNFINRVYLKVYGKEKYQKMAEEKTLSITKLVLVNPLILVTHKKSDTGIFA